MGELLPNQDLTFHIQSVPEPDSALLLLAGGSALLFCRTRFALR